MPTTSQDKPTVGRIVWVWLNDEEQTMYGLFPERPSVPFKGEVIFANPDTGLCTLSVAGHDGSYNTIPDVQIFDPEDTDCHGDDESYATWMPYQKAQHDQHREAAKKSFDQMKAEEGLRVAGAAGAVGDPEVTG